jgi:predicted acetyltransferase
MKVEVVEAGADDRPAVDRLAQLYQYDFTEFDDNDVDETGRFVDLDVDRFFDSEGRHVYVVRADGELAGFALVRLVDPVWYMSEFFVMRKYRRSGVGTRFAVTLFDRHPGAWEVRQIRANTPAQVFWRKVIGRYTDGEYTEQLLDDDSWDGPMQSFTA